MSNTLAQKLKKYQKLQEKLCIILITLEMEDWDGNDYRIPMIQKQLESETAPSSMVSVTVHIIKAEISFLQNHRSVSQWKSKNWQSIKEI